MSEHIHRFKCSCAEEHVHDRDSLRRGVDVSPGKPHRIVMASRDKSWIELDVCMPDGSPASGLGFRCHAPSGVIIGNLDEQGHARIEGVDEKESRIEFVSIPFPGGFLTAKDDIDG